MQRIRSVHIAGAIFTVILGSLLHFVWEWTGKSDIAALFSAVNESTWEHLKLFFVPFILFSIIEYFIYGKDYSCFWNVKAVAVVLGMFVITAAFYTYTGILGFNIMWLDIGTFVLGTAAAYIFSYKYIISNSECSNLSQTIAVAVILLLAAAFIIFTFYPPQIGLFADPTV